MGPMDEPVRVDKWLWAARFVKTRALAVEAHQGRARRGQRRARQAEPGDPPRRPDRVRRRPLPPLRGGARDVAAPRSGERGGAPLRRDAREPARRARPSPPSCAPSAPRAAPARAGGRPSATAAGSRPRAAPASTRRRATRGARNARCKARVAGRPWLPSCLLRLRFTLALLAVLCASAGWSARAPAQSESALRDRIERSRAHERELSGAVARLDALIARTGREIAIVQGRLDDVEAELVTAEARLAQTRADLRAARIRLLRLRRRLADGRATLAAQLVASYKSDPPDIVSLVLGAAQLRRPARAGRVHQARERAQRRRGRPGADRARRHAARDDGARAAGAAPPRRGRGRRAAPRRARQHARRARAARRPTLLRARAARARALAGTRSGRRSAQRSLSRLIAERERAAAAAAAGPGGPWAIPWPIVQCESGGQNLPPNSAGASGYYQMLPSTWKGLGGSTPPCLPGVQGRAGPARRAALGGRRRRAQLGLRRAGLASPVRVGGVLDEHLRLAAAVGDADHVMRPARIPATAVREDPPAVA